MQIVDELKDFFKDSRYAFVLLFGSYVSGKQSDLSDIDIGLYYPDEVDYMDLGYQSAILESKFTKKIDIIALNDVYKKDPLFGFEILNNHIPILIKDEAKYISFKTACQLYYLDHLPLIQMQKKAFLQRIKNDKIGERNFVTET